MEWEEVANVVSDERTAQRCSPLEDNDIAQAEQILVLGLDRLDTPSAAPEMGPNPKGPASRQEGVSATQRLLLPLPEVPGAVSILLVERDQHIDLRPILSVVVERSVHMLRPKAEEVRGLGSITI
jgi:hypothetical protein